MSNMQVTGERLEQAMETARAAQILRNGDRPEYAVLRYADLQSLIETLEDLADVLALSEARREDTGQHVSLADVLREFGEASN